MLRYSVIELSNVSEETIEGTLNEKTAQGWQFDGMQFAMRESSKRPAMAFLLFTREEEEQQEPHSLFNTSPHKTACTT